MGEVSASTFLNRPLEESSRRMPKRLTMVAIDKGGVGKSFFTIRLVEWLKQQHAEFLAFDPDYYNSTLTRFEPESEFLDIRHRENLDVLVERLNKTPTVVVDGIGGQQHVFLDWLEETRLLDFKDDLHLRITLVLIVEEDKDSVFQAGEAVKRVGSHVDWLVVKNRKLTPTSLLYDRSSARKMLLEHGAKELVLEKLNHHLVYLLQQNSWTIESALKSNSIYLLDRQRLVAYQRSINSQLDSVAPYLLP